MEHFQKLVLASASPRRQDMLALSGIPFEVIVSNIEELPRPEESGYEYVLRNAQEKALAVAQNVPANTPILSADTIVLTQAGHILEKPRDALHAKEMLQSISGDFHLVLSGYALFLGTKELVSRVVETKVYFRDLSAEEIEAYIQTKEPFDKAGAYGIQGHAMGFVDHIEGNYTNVMGLPLSQVIGDLKKFFAITPFTGVVV